MPAIETIPAPTSRRTRLSPEDRERMILEAAVVYFADHGFEATTGELARRLGVSTSLIFRYFDTKDALIERVYREVFLARWRPDWEAVLRDRSLPLRARLKAFYRSYLEVIDDRNWIRIAMRASLDGDDLTRRYIRQHVAKLLGVIALELRDYWGRPCSGPPREAEVETVWHLHSSAIYYLVRKHIHLVAVDPHADVHADRIVDQFMDGARPSPTAPPG